MSLQQTMSLRLHLCVMGAYKLSIVMVIFQVKSKPEYLKHTILNQNTLTEKPFVKHTNYCHM